MRLFLSSKSFSALSSRIFNSYKVTSLLILGLFLIFFALLPKRSVPIVSASLKIDGLHVMIKHVFELPPSDSDKIRVNLESLQGICVDLPSVKHLITIPSVVRDLFIVLASSNVYPFAPVFDTFSEPAKSTRNNLPVFVEKSVLLV